MFIEYLIRFINFACSLLILLIVLDVGLSWFLPPYHRLLQLLDRIVGPLLNPIRSAIPLVGMFDISPIILVILISVIQTALVNLLSTLR